MPFRRLLVLFSLVLLSATPARSLDSDQSARLDPRLRRVVERLEKGMPFQAAGVPGSEHLSDGRIPCFVRLVHDGLPSAAAGFTAQTSAGGLHTARLTVDEVLALASRAEVQTIEMAALARPLLDLSVPEILADQVHDSDGGNPPTYNGNAGAGVIVGVIDSGIDHQHADFWQGASPRILSIWDQTMGGTPPSGFGYGNECLQGDLTGGGGACGETDTNGHGTHVAGIAAGNGAATDNGEPAYTFVGTAPEADIIAVKSTFFTTDVVDGVAYIFDRAINAGKPAVVNLSLGTHYGPHDGTASFDTMLDALVGDGLVIVAAAGNEHGDGIHAEASVAGGNTETVTFFIDDYTPTPGGSNDIVDIDGWYDGGAQLTLTLTSPNGLVAGPVAFNNSQSFPTGDGRVTIDNGVSPQPNGDVNFHIEILDQIVTQPPANGTWTLDIEGTVVPAGAEALAAEVDMWLYYWSIPTFPFFVLGVDEAEIVGSPATADSIIAVGAYVTKVTWPSIDGNNYGYGSADSVGKIASFSSVGPRRDGYIKPDITAGGMGIFSALSSDAGASQQLIHPDGVHFLNQGTSMASPHIAGVVALIFDTLGAMYTPDVLQHLTTTARADAYTGSVPNSVFGWGKVDAQAAVEIITPVLIQQLEAQPEPWGVELSWSSPGDLRADAFHVLRALDDGSAPGELLRRAVLLGDAQIEGLFASYADNGLIDAGRYAYWVQAVFQGEPETPIGPVFAEWSPTTLPGMTLHPATPNPFRPNTTLHLELSRSQEVLVEILDPAGRRVRRLIKEVLREGSHRIEWDGRDDEGHDTASGLYFARVKAGESERVGRLVLIR